MDGDKDLIARIQQDCMANFQDEVRFCRLMRHSVRKLLDYCGAVVHVRSTQAPTRIIGLDIGPCFGRALRIAAHAIDRGAFFSRAYKEGPIVVHADHLRQFRLGPQLRQLASGHLVLSGHADLERASCSMFVFIGVRRGDTDQLKCLTSDITPCLHRVLCRLQQTRNTTALVLTPAERAICRLLLEGAHNKEIAMELGKSDATVRNQLHTIFGKLGVTTRAAAAAKILALGTAAFSDEGRKTGVIEQSYY